MASSSEILAAVEDEAARTGRILMEIWADGTQVDAEIFRAIEGRHDVVFILQSVRALVRESLDMAVEYSRRLEAGIEAIAERAERGDRSEALVGIAQLVEGLEWLTGIYDRCRTFVTAPLRPGEETASRVELLEAIDALLARAGEGDLDGAALSLRRDIAPRAASLVLRVQDLSRSRLDPQ